MDIAVQKQKLLARRKELAGHLNEVEHALDETMPKDWEDRASERQGDEVLEALGTTELNELKRIDFALERVENGTYGECQKCGDDVAQERLALLPDTPFCQNCAV